MLVSGPMTYRFGHFIFVLVALLVACGTDRRGMVSVDGGAPADRAEETDAALDGGAGVDGGTIADDASSTLDATAEADASVGCDGGGARCAGACVDTESDPLHCGACGVACASDELCFNGACFGDCSVGMILRVLCTRFFCVDPWSDPDHCGACGNVCGTGEACVDGTCTTMCPGADEVACDRFCRDLTTSVGHCGGCGLSCPFVPGIGTITTCTGSVCGYRCRADTGDCDGIAANGCETDTTASDAHCGACGAACVAPQLCADSACVTPRRVFVTDGTHDGDLVGAGGPSTICQNAADAASIGGTWRAWVCPGATVMSHATEPYVRIDGVKVADDWGDLTDGSLDATISVTETGVAVGVSRAWTGCLANGSQPATGANDCLNWTTGSDSTFGHDGLTSRTDSYWSWDEGIAGISNCRNRFRLYCIEQ